jgi:hypothetical protein
VGNRTPADRIPVAATSIASLRMLCDGRLLAVGDPRREHDFVIHALPMPSRAALPNAAIKYRLSQ